MALQSPFTPLQLATTFAVLGCAMAATVPACMRAVRLSRTAEARKAALQRADALIVKLEGAPRPHREESQ